MCHAPPNSQLMTTYTPVVAAWHAQSGLQGLQSGCAACLPGQPPACGWSAAQTGAAAAEQPAPGWQSPAG